MLTYFFQDCLPALFFFLSLSFFFFNTYASITGDILIQDDTKNGNF